MYKKSTFAHFLSIITIIMLFSCGQSPNENKVAIDTIAIELNDSAVKLYTTFDEKNILKAIQLLDRAIDIAPNYFLAYWNKFLFQNELNMKDQAFETIKTLELLRPQSPELILSLGAFYEKNGDSIMAIEKYRKANSIYESILDTIENNGVQYSMLQANKAITLILLGKELKGREILNDLLENETDEAVRELIYSFLAHSRQDYLEWDINK